MEQTKRYHLLCLNKTRPLQTACFQWSVVSLDRKVRDKRGNICFYIFTKQLSYWKGFLAMRFPASECVKESCQCALATFSYLKISVCPSSADSRRGVYPCLSHMFTFAPLSIRAVTTPLWFCLTAEKRAEPSTSSFRAPLALALLCGHSG